MKNLSLVEGFFYGQIWDSKAESGFVTNPDEAGSSHSTLTFIFVPKFILITGRVVMRYKLFGVKKDPLKKKRIFFGEDLGRETTVKRGQ